MKTALRKYTLALIAVFGFSLLSFSQISKSDVESMMTQQGNTMSDIKKIFVYNVRSFYTDGSNKYVYEEYADLKYSMTETGILIQGKSVQLFPFSSIKHMTVSATSFTIHLL